MRLARKFRCDGVPPSSNNQSDVSRQKVFYRVGSHTDARRASTPPVSTNRAGGDGAASSHAETIAATNVAIAPSRSNDVLSVGDAAAGALGGAKSADSADEQRRLTRDRWIASDAPGAAPVDPAPDDPAADDDAVDCIVFVGGVPYDVMEPELTTLFARFGEVKRTRLVRHHKTKEGGAHKGFGFVTFAEEACADTVRAMETIPIGDRAMSVSRAVRGAARVSPAPRGQREPPLDERSDELSAADVDALSVEAAPPSPPSTASHSSGFESPEASQRRSNTAAPATPSPHPTSPVPVPVPGAHVPGGFWSYEQQLAYDAAFHAALGEYYARAAPMAVPPMMMPPGGGMPMSPAEYYAVAYDARRPGHAPYGPPGAPFAGYPFGHAGADPDYALQYAYARNGRSPTSTHPRRVHADRRVFVGGLPRHATDEGLWAAFARFGGVEDARVVRDARTGVSKRYGFVTFAERAAAESVKALGSIELQPGVTIAVEDAWSGVGHRPPQRTAGGGSPNPNRGGDAERRDAAEATARAERAPRNGLISEQAPNGLRKGSETEATPVPPPLSPPLSPGNGSPPSDGTSSGGCTPPESALDRSQRRSPSTVLPRGSPSADRVAAPARLSPTRGSDERDELPASPVRRAIGRLRLCSQSSSELGSVDESRDFDGFPEGASRSFAAVAAGDRSRRSNPRVVSVHGLPERSDADDLHEFFSSFGAVLNVESTPGKAGVSDPLALVEFADEAVASEVKSRRNFFFDGVVVEAGAEGERRPPRPSVVAPAPIPTKTTAAA